MSFPIILVSPSRAENVGAAARAMKTMGFSELRIVNSYVWQEPAAYRVAHGAQDILDNARYFTDLKAALMDVDFSIGLTARSRARFRYYVTPAEAKDILREKRQWLCTMALVFGCEESGLSNAELAQVDLLSGIPMAQYYPSLNLAQAVMVYCYQFSSVVQEMNKLPVVAEVSQLKALKQRFQQLLLALNVETDTKLQDWLLQRLALAEQRDVAMLHQLLHDIEKKWLE
jgi:tRNA/rRNA methyltransferase